MSEAEYIAELKARWPQDCDATLEAISLADEAVRAFPQSPRLWCIRGDLIQLGPESCPYPLEEALQCYLRAIAAEPGFAEGWEEIGHYYDAILDDEGGAKPYFERAKVLRGEPAASSSDVPAEGPGKSRAVGGPPSVS